MTLLEKLRNKIPIDSLHVHEMYNDWRYAGIDESDIALSGMEFIGVCTDIRHKYDPNDCALVFYEKEYDRNHWIHITGDMYKNLLETEELKISDKK